MANARSLKAELEEQKEQCNRDIEAQISAIDDIKLKIEESRQKKNAREQTKRELNLRQE